MKTLMTRLGLQQSGAERSPAGYLQAEHSSAEHSRAEHSQAERSRADRSPAKRFGLALAVCAAALPSIAVRADSGPATTTVEIKSFAFAPKEITVKPGTKVVWINHDEAPHTVASLPGQPKVISSKAMDTDDKFEMTFTNAGDFGYLCTVHPFMTGTVHVKE